MQALRIETEATRIASKPRKTVKAPSASAKAKIAAAAKAEKWARRYTTSAVVMSAGLNAYASVTASGLTDKGALAAGVIGAAIPCFVWLLSTVAAWTYRSGWRNLAIVSAVIAAFVLALSVVHVTIALSALTGTHWLLSALLAIGIDVGLVACEATSVLVGAND